MANRYTLEVYENNSDGLIKYLDYHQIFGDNNYFDKLHNFAKNNLKEDYEEEYFELELNNEKLRKLYSIVDEICLSSAKRNRYIDILSSYDVLNSKVKDKEFKISFGECSVDIINYMELESGNLLRFLWKDYFENLTPQNIVIKPEYIVKFCYY